MTLQERALEKIVGKEKNSGYSSYAHLTLSQTTNIRLFQTEKGCRHFEI